jgi:hypothetical protein
VSGTVERLARLRELAGPAFEITVAPAADVEVGAGRPENNGVKRQSAPPSKPLPSERQQPDESYHARRRREAADRMAEKVERAKRFLFRNGGSATPAELRAEFGYAEKGNEAAKILLRRLSADAEIEVSGATKSRSYALTDAARNRRRIAADQAKPTTGKRGNGMPVTAGNGTGKQEPSLDGRIMGAVQLMERTTDQIAHEVGEPVWKVRNAVERLDAAGDLGKRPGGKWLARR